MSHPPDSTAHPRAEDDRVDGRAVVLVGVGALAIFTAAALAAMAYLRQEQAARPGPPLPAEIGQTKIGLVEQSPFFEGKPLRGEKDRTAKLRQLEGLGWVDREHGLAHIPIDAAMALVAAGARPARSEPPSAPALGAAHGGVDAPSVPVTAPRPAGQGGAR